MECGNKRPIRLYCKLCIGCNEYREVFLLLLLLLLFFLMVFCYNKEPRNRTESRRQGNIKIISDLKIFLGQEHISMPQT